MRHTLTIFLVLLSLAATAKKNGRELIDSLTNELTRLPDDTTKTRVLAKLARMYSSFNPKQGVQYAWEELAVSRKMRWQKSVAYSHINIGLNYQSLSLFDSSLLHFNHALEVSKKASDNSGIASAYYSIAYTHLLKGEFEKALKYNFLSEELFRKSGDTSLLASVWGNISAVYVNMSEYTKGLEYIFKAQKRNEETGEVLRSASNLGTIGTIYVQQQDFDKALEYYHKAMELNERMNNQSATAGNLGNIGAVYSYLRNDTMALEYMIRALKIYETIGQKANIAIVSGNVGEIYTEMGNYTVAISYLYRALDFAQETGNKATQAAIKNMLGNCYMNIAIDGGRSKPTNKEISNKPYIADGRIPKGRSELLKKARSYLNDALLLTGDVGNLSHRGETYQRLAKVDSLLGNYEAALNEYQQYVAFRDSIYNKQNKIDITNLITQRELELKDKQIEINKLKLAQKRSERKFYLAGIGLLLLVIGIIFRNYRVQKASNKLIFSEKERSEELLLNILPKEVADELKEKGTAEARQYDNVTVIFTDFVNFTEAGERMTPKELIAELDTCFMTFDEIVRKHGFEKIKTIGDAYLGVCGLPVADPNHAEKVVTAAKEIIDFMGERRAKLGNRTFEVRIGIHSGSVIAGIVGVMKFAYDIWGDTVNIAARMEQHSESGKINISQATYNLVQNKFTCTDRGEIEVKNKGGMRMYFVD